MVSECIVFGLFDLYIHNYKSNWWNHGNIGAIKKQNEKECLVEQETRGVWLYSVGLTGTHTPFEILAPFGLNQKPFGLNNNNNIGNTTIKYQYRDQFCIRIYSI